MPESDDRPIQHTPKHLEAPGVFDDRHPAASAFAPAQPAAGVVADDADEKGQNLAGGPKASDASQTYSTQKEELAKQHKASLQTTVIAPQPVNVEGDTAKPATKASGSTKSTSK